MCSAAAFIIRYPLASLFYDAWNPVVMLIVNNKWRYHPRWNFLGIASASKITKRKQWWMLQRQIEIAFCNFRRRLRFPCFSDRWTRNSDETQRNRYFHHLDRRASRQASAWSNFCSRHFAFLFFRRHPSVRLDSAGRKAVARQVRRWFIETDVTRLSET